MVKTFRKYFHHTKLSVFEGEISEAKLVGLYKELEKIIKRTEDRIKFFIIPNKNNVKKKITGIQFNEESSTI
ncbi:MAG: CRISPR-associated endonuclease Cas2 [Deltaproteobacteria bacterium]|nr:CRISPR-associated endonuclease Cas2 [Deltaproteobacteria bacterium]